jgi:hypothetical protein
VALTLELCAFPFNSKLIDIRFSFSPLSTERSSQGGLIRGNFEENIRGEDSLFGSSIFQPAQPRDGQSKRKSPSKELTGLVKEKTPGTVVSTTTVEYSPPTETHSPPTETPRALAARHSGRGFDEYKEDQGAIRGTDEVANEDSALPWWINCGGALEQVFSKSSLREFRKTVRPFFCGVI